MADKKHHKGLSLSQVEQSRTAYGVNILTPPKKQSIYEQLKEKFEDPIIRILLIALLLSVGVACYQYFSGQEGVSVFLEPMGILFAVLLATGVGFAFELSAKKKFEILSQVNDDTLVKVIRDSNVIEIPKRDVVVGDILVINTGDEIVADGILLEAVSLQVNESTLTGEPIIKKTTIERDFDKQATYPSNQALAGTTVVDGYGIVEVTAVGDATEYGKVYTGSQIENKIITPLNRQLDRLGTLITYASYAIAAFIIVVRLWFYFDRIETFDWVDAGGFVLNTVMIAVTVIVVTVPEGLPMSVTLSLALSMKRMLLANNLVRKMHACETMGATTVICTDKTGTLTQNQMRVHQADFFGLKDATLSQNALSSMIKEGISVNSTAFLDLSDLTKAKTIGNPTEAALLLWLKDQGQDYLALRESANVVDQLTFSTERKYMATVVRAQDGRRILYVKGAPEIVMNHCSEVLTEQGDVPIATKRSQIEQQLLAYQNSAMRTLGFAYKYLNDDQECFSHARLSLNDMIFIGIVAISDPVRSDVPQAIKDCINAGISIKIVTGDTPATAKEIARQIGLWGPEDTDMNHITGVEFAELSDAQLLDRIMDIKIMSRARPMDKERLVKLLQSKDQVVAVTGDGTNDAPALNAAQVGLSMGDGTSVAKGASDITILDNSFSSISKAVMWGRSLYQNIQKFILFQMTINVVACLIVMIGAFLGAESPLTVTQMLWVNLIMDTFAALALASLPPNEKVMLSKPRHPSDHIITKKMGVSIIGVGVLFVLFLFGMLQYFKHVDVVSLADFSPALFFENYFRFDGFVHGYTTYELSLFFTIFVMLQFWNMFNAKAFGGDKSAFSGIKDSLKGFVFVAMLIVVGQVLIVSFGGKMFSVMPISLEDWGIIILATSVVLWIGEVIRFIGRLRHS